MAVPFNQWHIAQRIATIAIGGLAFFVLLFWSALYGIRMAEERLPESAKLPEGFPPGLTLMVAAGNDAIYLGLKPQAVRDYFFSNRTPATRRQGNAEALGLRRLFSEIEVRTLEQDADTVRVELLSGPLRGKVYWMHVSQLSETK